LVAEYGDHSGAQRRETSAGEPVPQSEPAPGQPAFDGRHGPVELAGRLVVGHALEVAQLDRAPVLVREAVNLIAEDLAEITTFRFAGWIIAGRRRCFAAVRRASSRLDASPKRDPMGDSIEPAAERAIEAHRPRLAHQDQKSGLKGVLGLVGVAKYAAADSPYHRAVAIHERLKRQLRGSCGVNGFDALVREALEELAVGESCRGSLGKDGPKVPQRGGGFSVSHVRRPHQHRSDAITTMQEVESEDLLFFIEKDFLAQPVKSHAGTVLRTEKRRDE
jgi:hypothetical protein